MAKVLEKAMVVIPEGVPTAMRTELEGYPCSAKNILSNMKTTHGRGPAVDDSSYFELLQMTLETRLGSEEMRAAYLGILVAAER